MPGRTDGWYSMFRIARSNAVKVEWSDWSLKTLSGRLGIVVDRPEPLQRLFHEAALEEELALVGDDDGVGALDPVAAGDDAHQAFSRRKRGGGPAVDLVRHDVPVGGAVDDEDAEIGVARLGDHRAFEAADLRRQRAHEPHRLAPPFRRRSRFDVEADRHGVFLDLIGLPAPIGELRAEDRAVEAVDQLGVAEGVGRPVRSCQQKGQEQAENCDAHGDDGDLRVQYAPCA